ncbi:MAG: hypothetical protein WC466_08030 [Candidatus Izemoplasmatales bacterium]
MKRNTNTERQKKSALKRGKKRRLRAIKSENGKHKRKEQFHKEKKMIEKKENDELNKILQSRIMD